MIATHDTTVSLKAKLFRGLADPSRLRLIEALRDGEKAVGQLAEETGLSQPNTSAHLACLQDCGLVSRRQVGRFVYYALADARLSDMLYAAERILSDIGEHIDHCPRYDMETADG